jgi:hypothetical protein
MRRAVVSKLRTRGVEINQDSHGIISQQQQQQQQAVKPRWFTVIHHPRSNSSRGCYTAQRDGEKEPETVRPNCTGQEVEQGGLHLALENGVRLLGLTGSSRAGLWRMRKTLGTREHGERGRKHFKRKEKSTRTREDVPPSENCRKIPAQPK